MRPPSTGILRCKRTVEMSGNGLADGIEFGRHNTIGDPAAKIDQPRDRRRWPGTRAHFLELPTHLILERWRQRVEHGEMRAKLVALRREIAPPLAVEPGEIRRSQFGSDDQRRQISTWLPSSTTRLVGSLKNSIALSALRNIHANNFSRQIAIPGRALASKV